MSFNFNTQRVSSVVRQVLAVCVSIIGVLSANGTVLGSLPASVKAILTAFAPVLLVIEHFVSDPSTGNPPPPPPTIPPR
jgi:hypothetical protein